MSLPAVPEWLSLAIAVFGILGVITGQIVNTWRENKRAGWEAQRAHRTRLREQRVDAYSNYFAAVQDWYESASRVTLTDVTKPGNSAAVALRERCETARKRARGELARIDLVGSESVLLQAHDVYEILRSWSVDAFDGLFPSGQNRGLVNVDDAVFALRTAIRAELGADTDRPPDPAVSVS